jgi:hypothetical protein
MIKKRTRGPIEIGGQDGSVLGGLVNVWDGAINVNKYGMTHNTRKPYDELITSDKVYHIWEDLGKPVYFEVTISCDNYFQIKLLADKDLATNTNINNLDAGILCYPNDVAFIHDEEFKDLSIEILPNTTVRVSIFASGFLPDYQGVPNVKVTTNNI